MGFSFATWNLVVELSQKNKEMPFRSVAIKTMLKTIMASLGSLDRDLSVSFSNKNVSVSNEISSDNELGRDVYSLLTMAMILRIVLMAITIKDCKIGESK